VLRLWPARRAFPGILLGFSLLVTTLVPRPVQAAGSATIPQGPLPVGDLQPVEFSFLTIDGTIVPTDSGIAVQTKTSLRLRNPDKKNGTSRNVSYPNPASNVTGATAAQDQPGAWTLDLPPNGGSVIEASQSASADGPVVHLQFDWGALAPWGDSLASVRLTLSFPSDLDPEQLLAVSPAPVESNKLNLTWSYENFRPAGKIDVLMITPGYWRALRSARQLAASPQATAANQLALAAALRPLIAADGMPASRVAALRDEELAALRQAVALDGKNAIAHKELGLALAERAGGSPTLLAEAVRELKAAYDLMPTDSDLKAALLKNVDDLLAACRQAGDNQGILSALDVAQAVDSQRSAERLAAYADVAVSLVQAGHEQEAESLIVTGFGQQALGRYAYLQPQFAAVSGEVETHNGQRVLRFTFTPNPANAAAAETSVTALADALTRAGIGQVKRTTGEGQTQTIQVTFPFADSSTLQSAGQALTAALPADADPALTLAAAAISAPEVAFQNTRGQWSDHLTYSESVDLSPAQNVLDQRLAQLKTAQAEADAKTDDPAETAQRRWEAPLLKLYGQQWQQLTQRSQVTYRLVPSEGATAPSWVMAWGEKRGLTWEANTPHLERLAPYAIGVGVALLVIIVALALVLGRRRR